MTKLKIFLVLLFALVIFNARTGTEVFAADSGVFLGVTVLSVGPATINDFDYSPLSDNEQHSNIDNEGSVMGATTAKKDSWYKSFIDWCYNIYKAIF